MNICKYLITFFILFEIDFNKMWKQPLPNITDKVRLADLSGTIDGVNFRSSIIISLLMSAQSYIFPFMKSRENPLIPSF